ncbi:MAG: efflux RND transporter permease subunit, partial [Planctomycetia bacterium]|nr:efflux RND transporter permease subunit [Planctomycetia bacterium]
MNISSPFIRRPIMTGLLTLAVVLAGALGYSSLPVNDLPNVDFPTIQVTATLPGANAETMAAAVASPLEREFTAIPGLDGITSTSALGVTSITMQFSLSRNIDAAAQDVQTAIAKAARSLPDDMPSPPSFRKVNPSDSPIVLLTLRSDTLPLYEVNEYGESFLAQRMSQINGVAQVTVFGQQKKAVRVQVDPDLLAARGVGIDEVSAAIKDSNVNLPTGAFQGRKQAFNIQATGQLTEARGYRPVIVTYSAGQPLRLAEVATVVDGVENDKVAAVFTERTEAGEPGDIARSIMLAVYRQPGANTVEVAAEVQRLLPIFQAQLPASVKLTLMADRSIPIRESIHDVQITLLIAFGLVVMVIFVFLGSVRATLIPSLALPVSIVATFGVMHLMNYTLDNLSLLALTLAVGFVVDDAIVMLENVVRHLDMGKSPEQAALDGSAEVGFTIVSMTISLVAVFIPVLFMEGLVGRLLREFAVVISAAIVISGFVSVTLTPMLCAYMLKSGHAGAKPGLFVRVTEWSFGLLLRAYAWSLRIALRFRLLMLLLSFAFIAGTAYYLDTLPKGFLPSEDNGQITCTTEGPEDISFQGLMDSQARLVEVLRDDENIAAFSSTVGSTGFSASANAGRIFIRLAPREKRTLTADQVIARLRKKAAEIPGLKVFFQNPPPIRIGSRTAKSLYQFTVQGPDTKDLYAGAAKLEERLRKMPDMLEVSSDMQLRSPQLNVRIHRDKARTLGVTARQIEDALANAYGARQISSIYTPNNEYQVVLEVKPEYQEHPNLLSRLHVRSDSGVLVPIDALVAVDRGVGPLTVNHSGQLPSVTISFDLRPGVSLGDVLAQ